MSFDNDLVAKANAEWIAFGRDTGRKDHTVKVNGQDVAKETVEPYASRVGDFWLAVPSSDYNYLVAKYAKGKGKLDGTVTAAPWSAAFISYCMQGAGAGDAFPYSAGHSTWIVRAIKACLDGRTDAPLVGYKLRHHTDRRRRPHWQAARR